MSINNQIRARLSLNGGETESTYLENFTSSYAYAKHYLLDVEDSEVTQAVIHRVFIRNAGDSATEGTIKIGFSTGAYSIYLAPGQVAFFDVGASSKTLYMLQDDASSIVSIAEIT